LVDFDEWDFHLPKLPSGSHLPVFNKRAPVLALDLFNFFLPESLLRKVWVDNKEANPLVWEYGVKKRRCINGGDFVYATILFFLACQIRIIALQNKPMENVKNTNPLRESFNEARTHFGKVLFGDEFTGFAPFQFPGIEILERLNAHFQFTANFFDAISKNFQAIVKRIGEYAAGDEKLLHFTGDSSNIRMILTKPDRVGHWFYELCIKLKNGLSYLLYFRAHLSDTGKGISIRTSEIVKEWTDITTSLGRTDSNTKAVTCFDSYYLCNNGRNYCNENKKPFVAAIQRNRFEAICDSLSGLAHEKGEFAGVYNDKTNELLIKYFDPNHDAPKYVLSNAFIKKKKQNSKKRKVRRSTIPVYSEYAEMFNLCDRFNRNLHERTWPHKTGGRGNKGEHGHYHNFAISATLQNIFNLYHAINDENHTEVSFCEFCCGLADDIARFAHSKN
jgi:hypothetical protein